MVLLKISNGNFAPTILHPLETSVQKLNKTIYYIYIPLLVHACPYTCKAFFPTTISNVPYKRAIIDVLLHAHCSYCTVTSSSNHF